MFVASAAASAVAVAFDCWIVHLFASIVLNWMIVAVGMMMVLLNCSKYCYHYCCLSWSYYYCTGLIGCCSDCDCCCGVGFAALVLLPRSALCPSTIATETDESLSFWQHSAEQFAPDLYLA